MRQAGELRAINTHHKPVQFISHTLADDSAMPSGSSQNGSGKKGAGTAVPKPSRNSTPVPPAASSLPPQEFYDPDYLQTRVILLPNLKYDDLVDQASASAAVPDPRSVDGVLSKLSTLMEIIEKRSTFYDRGMRFLSDERKKYPDTYAEPEEKHRKHKKKKTTDALVPPESSAAVRSSPLRESKRKHSREPSSSLSPVADGEPTAMEVDEKVKKDEEEESSSEDEAAPPRREMPHSQTFGEDPSTFPDPTIYEIRDTHSGMTDEEKKEIYSVAVYPRSDLADLIAGDPPDKDFSNAKPSSQINFSTFTTYLEPYFRPFGEEDLGFLRERGDRVNPFLMPKCGKRHYTEIWAEDDGAMSIDTPQQGRDKLPANQSRGTIENMSDSVGETDGLSIGPLVARLLSAMRPEHRVQPSEDKPMANGITNGDVVTNGEVNGEEPNGANDKGDTVAPATFMTESSTETWKKAVHPKLDYGQMDERVKQELRYVGFYPQEGFDGDYDGHFDDEVAARLRHLQERLKLQILVNGARKARVMDIIKERMAHQEYSTILEDLDSQVQGAYLKRTRTMGKSKKTKRPGGAGGGSHVVGGASGTARPGIGDLAKTLMERRKRWITTIGSVFDDVPNLGSVPRVADPNSSIFRTEDMTQYMKGEQQLWDEEVEDE